MAKFGKWASRIIIALLAIGAIAVVTCAALVWFRPQIFEAKQEDEAPAEKLEPQIKAVSAKCLQGRLFGDDVQIRWHERQN